MFLYFKLHSFIISYTLSKFKIVYILMHVSTFIVYTLSRLLVSYTRTDVIN